MISDNLRDLLVSQKFSWNFVKLCSSFPWPLKNGSLDMGLNLCSDKFPALQSLIHTARQVYLQRSCVSDLSLL